MKTKVKKVQVKKETDEELKTPAVKTPEEETDDTPA